MTELEQLRATIDMLESQRGIMGDAMVDIAIEPLKEKIKMLEKAYLIDSDQKRKTITVLFADVSGFTAMSELIDAEEVSETMNSLWEKIDGIIIANKGIVDKHIGDAVMALFGADETHENDPELAIDTALEMQKALIEFNSKNPVLTKRKLTLAMRIGINTGPVLLGNVGSTNEFTAMGDSVNVASRLEHAAPIGGVLISHDTHRNVRGIYNEIIQEPLLVKGKQEPIKTYVMLAKKSKAFRLKSGGIDGVKTQMIGRTDEFSKIIEHYSRTIGEHKLHRVTLSGETGLGKSRLVEEYVNWVHDQTDSMDLLIARCEESGKNHPYALIEDFLSNRFQISDTLSNEKRCEKLVQGFSEFLTENHEEKAHYVGQLIGYDFSESPHLIFSLHDQEQLRNKAYIYLAELIKMMVEKPIQNNIGSEKAPLSIIIEDLHWIDEGSYDAIQFIAKRCSDLPIIVLSTTRPEFSYANSMQDEALKDKQEQDEADNILITLRPLTKDASKRLVSGLLTKVQDLPFTIIDLISEKTGGNPYCIEEFIKMIIDEKIILTNEECWTIKDDKLTTYNLPSTLTGVMQMRLEGLSELERRLLSYGSVMGSTFWDSVLLTLDHQNLNENISETNRIKQSKELMSVLKTIRTKGMIQLIQEPKFADATEYLFSNGILREATYEAILLKHRKILHEQAANWMIDHVKEKLPLYADLISKHFECCEKYDQASIWMGIAAERAKNVFALETAIELFTKTLELIEQSHQAYEHSDVAIDPKLKLQLHDLKMLSMDGLAEMLRMRVRHGEAAAYYDDLIREAELTNDMYIWTKALNGKANVCESQGNYQLMLECSQKAEKLVSKSETDIRMLCELAFAIAYQGKALYRMGKYNDAETLARKANEIATRIGSPKEMGYTLNLIGMILSIMGRNSEAISAYEMALKIEQSRGDRNKEAGLLNNIAGIAVDQYEYDFAMSRFEEALSLSQEIGMRDTQLIILANMGLVEVIRKQYEHAIEVCQRALEIASDQKWQFRPIVHSAMGHAYCGVGNCELASTYALEGWRMSENSKSSFFRGYAYRVLGVVYSNQQDSKLVEALNEKGLMTPEDCFSLSHGIFEESGQESDVGSTLLYWADFEKSRGHMDRGKELAMRAYALYERLDTKKICDQITNEWGQFN